MPKLSGVAGFLHTSQFGCLAVRGEIKGAGLRRCRGVGRRRTPASAARRLHTKRVPGPCQQIGVPASLDGRPVVVGQDLVGLAHRGEPVRHHDQANRSPTTSVTDRAVQLCAMNSGAGKPRQNGAEPGKPRSADSPRGAFGRGALALGVLAAVLFVSGCGGGPGAAGAAGGTTSTTLSGNCAGTCRLARMIDTRGACARTA